MPSLPLTAPRSPTPLFVSNPFTAPPPLALPSPGLSTFCNRRRHPHQRHRLDCHPLASSNPSSISPKSADSNASRTTTVASISMNPLRRIADLANRAAAARHPRHPSRSSLSSLSRLLGNSDAQPSSSSSSPTQAPLSEQELSDIATAVSSVTAEHLALDERAFRSARDINFVSVAEHPNFTMAVFVLPAGAALPVHDHPHMCVVSSVLWGALEVTTYDRISSSPTSDSSTPATAAPASRFSLFGGKGDKTSFLTVKRKPDVLYPGELRSLTPTVGNIHRFRAVEPTAVFDVLVPPYDPAAHRPCHYFRVVDTAPTVPDPPTLPPGASLALLREAPCPSDYYTVSYPYKGVPVTDP